MCPHLVFHMNLYPVSTAQKKLELKYELAKCCPWLVALLLPYCRSSPAGSVVSAVPYCIGLPKKENLLIFHIGATHSPNG
jgi:hypothetical protein